MFTSPIVLGPKMRIVPLASNKACCNSSPASPNSAKPLAKTIAALQPFSASSLTAVTDDLAPKRIIAISGACGISEILE